VTANLPTPAIDVWPALPQSAWSDTCSTLQLWLQIVGKIRLALMPPINHTWQVTLYPTTRGLTTDPMPYGSRMLQIDLDFQEHRLELHASDRPTAGFALEPMTVAAFYQRVIGALATLDMPVRIWPKPCEVANPIPFQDDVQHRSYDPEYVQRFSHVVLQASRVFTTFRARFRGKVSPVHLFWGAMDLACTRFSGLPAPPHPSTPGLPDRITRDAYSHEVSSAGFWPGAPGVDALFYSYAYPEPPGYRDYPIAPAAASFSKDFGEFVLPYEEMRTAADPDNVLLSFLQTTYDAAANCAKWDREALEVAPPPTTA